MTANIVSNVYFSRCIIDTLVNQYDNLIRAINPKQGVAPDKSGEEDTNQNETEQQKAIDMKTETNKNVVPFLRENPIFKLITVNPNLSEMLDCGKYNGYVAVPKGNRYHGLSMKGRKIDKIEVHGGITFSEPVTVLESDGEKMRNPILDDATYISDDKEIGFVMTSTLTKYDLLNFKMREIFDFCCNCLYFEELELTGDGKCHYYKDREVNGFDIACSDWEKNDKP